MENSTPEEIRETPEQTFKRVIDKHDILDDDMNIDEDALFEACEKYHSERLKIEAPLLPNEYKRGFQDGEISKGKETDTLLSKVLEQEAEIERLKQSVRECASDCIEERNDVKFCSIRNGEGGKCKWCI